MNSVLASATRREPIHGGSVPASLRATVAEANTESMSSCPVGHIRLCLRNHDLEEFLGDWLYRSGAE